MPQLLGDSSDGGIGLDPAGFQINVVMNTPDGARFPLWMQGFHDGAEVAAVLGTAPQTGGVAAGGTLSGFDLAAMDLPIVESVEIQLSLGLVGKVTVEVSATYELGLLLLDSAFFHVGNTIEVQLGYPRSNRFTPWMTAITSKPSLRVSAEEGLTATLNGEGGSMAALRGVSARTWTGMSYFEIVEAIAKEHDWDTNLPGDKATTAIAEVVGGDPGEFLKKRKVISQTNMSDWHFIQHISHASNAHAHLGPSAELGRTTVSVVERKDMFSGEPRFKFISRGNSDFVKVFPALEFETEAEFVWLPGGAVKTTTRDIHCDTKKLEEFEATEATSPAPTLGEGGVPTSANKKVESSQVQLVKADGAERAGELLYVSCRDPRGPKALAQANRDALAIKGGVTARVTSFGIPELFPGDMIQQDALGIFNGLYGINELTHTANDTEWNMSMTLLNNASAAGIFHEFFVDKVENTNTAVVDEEGGPAGDEVNVDAVEGGL